MEPSVFVEAVDREGHALLAAGRKGLTQAVPSCPGWTVADLMVHVGQAYWSTALHVERRATERVPRSELPAAPEGEAVVDHVAEALERLLAALRDVDPAQPIYTWSGMQPAASYQRRAAHESAVHRWDAESAHGTPGPFDPDLAADGVSEFYEAILPFAVSRMGRPLPAGSLHLHRTDGAGEWTVRADGDRVVVDHSHGKGDAAARGPAGELLLLVWNRRGLDGLEVFGDPDVVRAWSELAP